MNRLGEYSVLGVHVQRCSGGSGVLCIITVLIRWTRSCHITSFSSLFFFFIPLHSSFLPLTLLLFSTCHLTGVSYPHSSRPLLNCTIHNHHHYTSITATRDSAVPRTHHSRLILASVVSEKVSAFSTPTSIASTYTIPRAISRSGYGYTLGQHGHSAIAAK